MYIASLCQIAVDGNSAVEYEALTVPAIVFLSNLFQIIEKDNRRESAEIFVSGDMGVVRGRTRLVWEYDGTRTTIPEGNYVMIAVRRDEDWRIRLLTWNDDPRKWLQEPID